ncbi:MAG: dihydroorotase [Puniceicoccales bacterium]|nr:dihydroorotase [Puniceicoccales bacterium]
MGAAGGDGARDRGETADFEANILPTGTITLGRKGEKLAPIGSLKSAGAVAVTDGTTAGVQNTEIMRRALEYAAMFGLVVLDHCQDSSMTAGAVMHEGVWSVRLGLRGFPAAAEEIVVASDILLARLAHRELLGGKDENIRVRIHLQHITSANSLRFIRDAKADGVPVTAEVSANHLLLTDDLLRGYDTNLKLAAPLRSETDRLALLAALRDGTLDAVVSDHTPVTPTEKDCEFDYAPFGSIGLETALAATITAFAQATPEDIPLPLIVEKLTASPARVLGLDSGTLAVGKPADVVIFDPVEEWVPGETPFFSRSSNCALRGHKLRGRVKTTLVAGKIVFDNGQIFERENRE